MRDRPFRVRGRVQARWLERWCDCPDCTGHDTKDDVPVDLRVYAQSVEHAQELALSIERNREGVPWPRVTSTWVDWLGKPEVLDLQHAQDQLMREIGAPMLPGLEVMG